MKFIHPKKWIAHFQNLLCKETQIQQAGVDAESEAPKGPSLNHLIHQKELSQASKN